MCEKGRGYKLHTHLALLLLCLLPLASPRHLALNSLLCTGGGISAPCITPNSTSVPASVVFVFCGVTNVSPLADPLSHH